MVLCTALLPKEMYLPTEFLVNTHCHFRIMSWTKFKVWNKQRAITPKLGKAELWLLSNALLLNEIYLPTKFEVDISCSFRLMSRTKFKVKNKLRAITPTLGKVELWLLCNAFLLNEIYLPTKFELIYLVVWDLCPGQNSKWKGQ